MSLRVEEPGEIPAGTVRVARRAFPGESLAIRIRDEPGVLFRDEDFAVAFPRRGKPAWSSGRLALVVVLQFVEGLTDRQAAEAVRARIDWTYALGLELEDPGFDYSVLSEFRDRPVACDAGRDLLDAVQRLPVSLDDFTTLIPGGGRHQHPTQHGRPRPPLPPAVKRGAESGTDRFHGSVRSFVNDLGLSRRLRPGASAGPGLDRWRCIHGSRRARRPSRGTAGVPGPGGGSSWWPSRSGHAPSR